MIWFGFDFHYVCSYCSGQRKHMGLDIVCTDGATVYAPFDVKINGRAKPYGNNNAIDDGISLSGGGLYFHHICYTFKKKRNKCCTNIF